MNIFFLFFFIRIKYLEFLVLVRFWKEVSFVLIIFININLVILVVLLKMYVIGLNKNCMVCMLII